MKVKRKIKKKIRRHKNRSKIIFIPISLNLFRF